VDTTEVSVESSAGLLPPSPRPRQRPATGRAWFVFAGGTLAALIGLVLGIVALTGYHALATVTRQGPCVNSSSAGLVCTEHVTYTARNGQSYSVTMSGVNPKEVHGPAGHRTLAITYSSGYETSPSTDDMPNAVPIVLLAGGVAMMLWGLWIRRGVLRGQRRARQKSGH
jgi:hypothetical protein